jgi:PAS domain S-box-containing protein
MSTRRVPTNDDFTDLKETERRLREIFDGAFEFIGLLKPDGTMIEANRTALNYIGARATEVIGRPFWETAWWKSSAEQQQRLKAAIAEAATGKFVRFEAQHTGQDGSVDVFDFSLKPATDDVGRVIFIVSEARRITERKRAEEAGATLAAIVSSANDAIISTRDAVIQTWNTGAERLLGWSAAEAIGQDVTLLLPPTRLHEKQDIMARLNRGEPVPHFDTVRRRKDGSLVDVSFAISPVKLDGEIIGASAIIRDISERKLTQAALSASEERWRALLASIPGMVFTADANGENEFVNDYFYAFTGLSPDLGLRGGWVQSVHPDDRERAYARWMHCVRTGEPYENELRIRRHDGVYRWFRARGVALRDEHGRIVKWAGGTLDIEDIKQTQLALSESEERFRLLAQNIDRVFWFAELEPERVVYVSPAFEQLWGVSADRLYDNPRLWIDMIHPEDRSNVRRAFQNWITGRAKTYNIEYRILRHDGEVHWMHDRGIVIGFKDGLPYKLGGIVKDVTERKRAEEERKEADRRKDEFIATLAHELRNPLAPIRNVISLLQLKGSLQPDVQRARDVISRQIDHLTRLIDDLLDVSRITSDKLELRKERVNLAEVINLAVESSHPFIDQHHHKLSLLLPGKPIYLNADKIRLAQVITNLLSNAAKYTPDEGRITLSAEHNGEEVAVRVTDNGIGIAPNQLPNIFDMFYQANRSYEQLHGGLGIGLTLVRRLVEMHGGQVEAHSGGIDQGSEFVVHLPIRGEQARPQNETAGAEPTSATVRRILVVDDLGEIAETLAELLRFDGHDVEIATDGLKAIEIAETFRPSVVLLDIGMPKLNGYEVASKIREQPWGKDMVLIALTGWGQEKDRNRSRQAGFNAHLLKPFDYPELSKLIANLSSCNLTDAS